MQISRRNFSFDLSARRVVWPVWGVMLLVGLATYACYVLMPHPEVGAAGVVMDSDFVLRTAGLLGVVFGVLVALAALTFPLMTATMEAVGLDGEPVATNYDFGGYMRKVLWWSLLSTITLGIFLPWYQTRITRYFFSEASYRHRPLGFHAKGMGLFSIIVLVYMLPIMVVCFLMERGVISLADVAALDRATLILAGVVLLMVVLLWMSFSLVVCVRWMVNMSCGEERLLSTLTLGKGSLFVLGQLLLTILTLGLYTPMMELRLVQYFAEGVDVGEERRLGMSLRPWRDWLYVWAQSLLVLVTCGLYMPWYYTKILRRFIPRLYLEHR
jgi:uncharacterized membrane protein YjgN (DUF898 family)